MSDHAVAAPAFRICKAQQEIDYGTKYSTWFGCLFTHSIALGRNGPCPGEPCGISSRSALIDTTAADGIINLSGRSFGYDRKGSYGYDSNSARMPATRFPEYPEAASDLYFIWPDSADCATRVQYSRFRSAISLRSAIRSGACLRAIPGEHRLDTNQIPPEITGIWLGPSWHTTPTSIPLVDMRHTGALLRFRTRNQKFFGEQSLS